MSALSRRGGVDLVFVSFHGAESMVLRGYQSLPRLKLHWLVDTYPEPASSPEALFRLGKVAANGPNVFESGWSVRAPHWALALPPAAVGIAGLAPAWRRRSRRLRGLCVSCGYDLRHSTGRCPECGSPIVRAPETG